MAIEPGVDTKKMNDYASGNIIKIPLKDPSNPVRIVSGPSRVSIHWFPTVVTDDSGEERATSRPVNCTGDPARCPICIVARAETSVLPKSKEKKKARSSLMARQSFYYAAISRKEQEAGSIMVRPLEVGWQIQNQLHEYHNDPKWGDINTYDVDIRRGTNKGGYAEYKVHPDPDTRGQDWTPEEITACKEADSEMMANLVRKTDPELMKQFLVDHPLLVTDPQRIKNPEVVSEACVKVDWQTQKSSFVKDDASFDPDELEDKPVSGPDMGSDEGAETKTKKSDKPQESKQEKIPTTETTEEKRPWKTPAAK